MEVTNACRSIRMRNWGMKGASRALAVEEIAVLTQVSYRQNATDIKGGMTIYYTQKDFDTNGDQHITAFPPVSCALFD